MHELGFEMNFLSKAAELGASCVLFWRAWKPSIISQIRYVLKDRQDSRRDIKKDWI